MGDECPPRVRSKDLIALAVDSDARPFARPSGFSRPSRTAHKLVHHWVEFGPALTHEEIEKQIASPPRSPLSAASDPRQLL